MSKVHSSSKWKHTKEKWKRYNRPDKDGYYICWICGQKIHISAVSLDHVIEVSKYPELADDLSNIKPSHAFCNQHRSGSRQLYLHRKNKRFTK